MSESIAAHLLASKQELVDDCDPERLLYIPNFYSTLLYEFHNLVPFGEPNGLAICFLHLIRI